MILFLMAGAGLALLYFGGELLVRGAVGISSRLGMSALAIGLTVVASGTSAPELAVSISAALAGSDDIAVANVVGSNIANIALILGLTAIIHPMKVDAKIFRVDAPLMLGVSIVLMVLLGDHRISRLEALPLVIGLVCYVSFTLWEARQSPDEAIERDFADGIPHATARGVWLECLQVVAGIMLLAGGGRLLVDAASELAAALGVSQRVIGLTIVAVGTSLPELTTSLIAALRGHANLAIGNIIGSNIFNVLGILGIAALVHPLNITEVHWVDLALVCALSMLFCVFLYTRRELERYEGAFLFVTYLAYTTWLLAE